MHLMIITGFLGSGKTTLVMAMAQKAIKQGKKVAIIVNEVGDVGIDGDIMKPLGADVWELYSGCICCTLSADIAPTLEKLDREYQVDLVLMEATGVAEPENILQALPQYHGCLSSVRSFSILDPLRIKEVYAVLTPLITNQIIGAEVIIINKLDIAEKEHIEEARRIVNDLNPRASVLEMSARAPLSEEFLKEVLPWGGF